VFRGWGRGHIIGVRKERMSIEDTSYYFGRE
jgi:hypothetical protein